MFKKILIAITLSLAIFASCMLTTNQINVKADSKSITYVAFGDSIAEGYAINLKSKDSSEILITGADESYDLVDGSYVDLINTELKKTYSTTAYNYAYSGDTCQDMLDFISEFYDVDSNSVKDESSANATYPTLTNKQVYESVKNANIITVCIGSNNILGIAPTLITQFLGLSTPTITRADMEESLKDNILGNSDKDIKGLKAEFDELLNVFNSLNPNAYIYFTNAYNPYKVLKADSSLLSMISSYGAMLQPSLANFTQENLDIISEVADMAIGGGKDSSGNDFTGINNVIEDAIKNFNSEHSGNRLKYIDSKEEFDSKYDTSNIAKYNDYVNTQIDKVSVSDSNIKINDLSSSINYITQNFLDPHPTYEGHKLILKAHNEVGLEAYIPVIDYKVEIKVNNSTTISNSYSLEKNQNLQVDVECKNTDYTYTYNYTIKNEAGKTSKTYNTNNITINYTDLEYGNYSVYLTITTQDGEKVLDDNLLFALEIKEPQKYTINFVTGFETAITEAKIYEGEKVEKPQIERTNYILIGWFIDSDFITEWNFETDVVTDNLTLYAKWEKNTYTVTFDFNGGELAGQTQIEKEVVKNGKLQALTNEELPTKAKNKLLGWYKSVNVNDTTPFDFENTSITSNMTLYAKWEQVVFDVVLNYNGGKVNNEDYTFIEVEKGKVITEPSGNQIPVLEDYKLIGWYKENACINKWNFAEDVVSGDMVLYAGWKRNVFYVTLNYNGGSYKGGTSRTIKVKETEQLTKPQENKDNLEKDKYLFVHWYLENEETAFEFPAQITEDITLYAYWKEAITVNIRNVDNTYDKKLIKGSTVADLTTELNPTKIGTVFLGWYEDSLLSNEYHNSFVLEDNQMIYAKWVTLSCVDEKLLNQSYSPVTKLVGWHIDAKDGSELVWLVNGEETKRTTVTGNDGYTWSFAPTAVGDFKISCKIGNVEIVGSTVKITYSIPNEITISLTRVSENKYYFVEVDNYQYYNPEKFVWFKTEDSFSDDFSIKIGTGVELNNYKFSSDCKICVKYLENEDSTDGLTSNIINVKVDNYVDETTLFAIVISISVVVLVVIGVLINRKKYNDFY